MLTRLYLYGTALAAAAVLLLPGVAPAQTSPTAIPRSYDVAGYSPHMYSHYATVGPPSYLTSTQYPGIYGQWSYGASVPNNYITPRQYTNYPETYTSVLPPVASINGQSRYYLTATRPEGAPTATAPTRDVSLARLSAMAPATIDINVPETAVVSIQGREMSQRGTLRRFVSPQLSPALAYSYDIMAIWREGDHDLRRTQRVVVRAGESTSVSFVPTSETPTLRTTGETYFSPVGTAGPSMLPPSGR